MMLNLFLLLVALSSGTSSATAPPGAPPSTHMETPSGDASAQRVQSTETVVRGADLIFEDDFESGGALLWGDSLILSTTTIVPWVDFSSCDLEEGTYTLRVDADNLLGGATYEYVMTVTERRCGVNQCKDVTVSEPTIVFR